MDRCVWEQALGSEVNIMHPGFLSPPMIAKRNSLQSVLERELRSCCCRPLEIC